MVQKKEIKKEAPKAVKKSVAIPVVTPKPQPMAAKPTPTRQVNYPVLSFILFVVACVIYFSIGYMFSTLAVDENFCNIRQKEGPKKIGEVVAFVNNEPIYMSEIKDYASSIPQLAELDLKDIYPQLLETVVNSRVLRTAADQAGTAARPDVQRALRLAEEQVIAQAYLDKRLKALQTEERLQQLYQSEIKNFKPVDEIRARHILLKTEQEAKDIAIQLKAGASFSMLASRYSQDQSAPDGDLGYFTEDMMIPEFGRAAFALRKDQISEPVKSPFGWHIIQVIDRRLSEPPAYTDIKENLKQLLTEKDMEKIMADERKRLGTTIRKPKM